MINPRIQKFGAATLIIVALVFSVQSFAASPTKASLGGQFLLDSSTKKIWFTELSSGYRYDVSSSKSLRTYIQRAAYLVPSARLALLPVVGSADMGDTVQRQRYAGTFVTDGNGTFWYMTKTSQQRLDVTSLASARQLAHTVTPKAIGMWPMDPGVQSGAQRVVSARGAFSVSYAKANLNNPVIRLMSDNLAPGLGTCGCPCNPESLCNAAYHALCPATCSVQSFSRFVQSRNALAAINGTYFHTPPSINEVNSSDLSVMNSFSPKQEITRNPLSSNAKLEHPIVIDSLHHLIPDPTAVDCPVVYKGLGSSTSGETVSFGVMTDCFSSAVQQQLHEKGSIGKLQALISTDAFLVLNGKNVISKYPLDTKQKTVRTSRDFFGVKGRTIYFVVVNGATMYDAAAVATAMKFDMAANLDGGGSSALYANGKYLVGPGRAIPNALLITR